jgi:nucleotide-binding universal stress UspA family protein
MLTRILAALDGNPASEAAARLALDLAATHKAALHGFAPVDLPWITRPMAVGIGGMSHRMTLEASELSRARRGAEYAQRGIAEAAAARGIACTTATADGDPPDLVCAAAADADLIVLGHDASFGGDTPEEGPSPNLHALLARNTRPLLIVPKTHAPGPVLVAYDGSPPSMRALHMAALLGIAKGGTAAVLCADDDAAVATSRAETAARLLRAHGTEVGHLLPQHAGRDPATLITAEAQRLGAGTVVMGAYGHNGLKERLFGSCTRTLLRECPAALFVHH